MLLLTTHDYVIYIYIISDKETFNVHAVDRIFLQHDLKAYLMTFLHEQIIVHCFYFIINVNQNRIPK